MIRRGVACLAVRRGRHVTVPVTVVKATRKGYYVRFEQPVPGRNRMGYVKLEDVWLEVAP